MSDELSAQVLATLDRFERWSAITAAALSEGKERWEKQHTYSFDWWPDAEILRQAETAFCCEASQDGRFWKNGNIRKPAGVLMQLEIALRYGPHAIDECDVDDLAEEIGGMVRNDPFERVDTDAPDHFCTLLRSTVYAAEPDEAEKAWEAIHAASEDPVRKTLTYLVPRCLDLSPNHPDEISHVVMFCAAAGVMLLDDTGWLVPEWRSRAIVVFAQITGLMEMPK